jgi:hypothetical protein
MDTQTLVLDRAKARELYRAYKKHAHYSQPMDDEIRRAYQLLAQGRLLIRALDSIVKAGVDPATSLPKLAICRADQRECNFIIRSDGSSTMTCENRWWRRGNAASSKWIDFPRGSFGAGKKGTALVPLVPINLRPKRGLANYHILWEAEWRPLPPHDPFLLRRIGQADLWLVVAMWDLSEVERAVMAGRIGNA